MFVIDASALVAMFKGEPGHEIVRAALPDCVIGIVNLSEFAEHIVRLGGTRSDVEEAIRPLPCRLADADEALGLEAAEISRSTRRLGLSLGDRFCLALARKLGVPALTGDRRWTEVAGEIGVEVELIR